MNLPRLGNDRPDDKRAERNAVTELGRQQRNAKAKTQHGNQEHFIALEFAHITDQTRHRDQTDHQHHDQENTQLAEGHADRTHAQRAGHGDAGQQRYHGDAQNVLDDQNSENQLSKLFFGAAHFGQHFDDHRGGRHGKHGAEEETVRVVPSGESAEFISDPTHDQNFQERGDDGRAADFL